MPVSPPAAVPVAPAVPVVAPPDPVAPPAPGPPVIAPDGWITEPAGGADEQAAYARIPTRRSRESRSESLSLSCMIFPSFVRQNVSMFLMVGGDAAIRCLTKSLIRGAGR